MGAAWASPTTSSCGAIIFTRTVIAIQNKTIGTASMRRLCAITGLFACLVAVSVMRTSPGSTSER